MMELMNQRVKHFLQETKTTTHKQCLKQLRLLGCVLIMRVYFARVAYYARSMRPIHSPTSIGSLNLRKKRPRNVREKTVTRNCLVKQ